MSPVVNLSVLPDTFAVCRLPSDLAVPIWVGSGEFVSITRTADELSIVCVASAVPLTIKAERGWRALRVDGTLDFALIGILAALTTVLAEAEISVFAISTYDTDYLLLKADSLADAITALTSAGHQVQ